MRNLKFFGVPIALWLFPPIALMLLFAKVVKETQTKGKEENKNG